MELKDWLQLLTIVVTVIISAFTIFHQMKNTNKQIEVQIENNNKQIATQNEQKKLDYEYKRKEKAVEMAIIFQKILKDASFIMVVLEKTKLKEIYYDKIKFNELKKFDYNELVQKFNPKTIEEIKIMNDLNGIDPFELINLYVNFNYADAHFLKLLEKKDGVVFGTSDEFQKAILIIKNHIWECKGSVLNKLEWFSMNFNLGLADENVVYQSLHQVFLSSVKLLHYEISDRNRDGLKDKYFCNIIDLYKRWSERYYEAWKEEKELEEQKKLKEKEFEKQRKELAIEHEKEEDKVLKKYEKFEI